ncbi:hypothetical protein MRS76_01425 [Rhizobiaceae bacterium n13]|uniref:Uncharacterized protein n=1 Tax=Ferirhizobium litorale TaxID=2927786 RepID=A0AAE3Q7N9_9HYPH|nr:hypothetical protein [Fererhizobium litorale]MDI7860604.1 hypothetical protein [Fererhizobium litorale]MDI7920752.1 hypothetical protein [Fererhizobium litorale]
MMLEQAGFALLSLRDTTVEMGQIASRLHHARQARREVLCVEEGRDWFDSRQAFLSTVAQLAESRRLSRYLYIAEKRTS